jgi:hypothetical protein
VGSPLPAKVMLSGSLGVPASSLKAFSKVASYSTVVGSWALTSRCSGFRPHSQYTQLKVQIFPSLGNKLTPSELPSLLLRIGPNTKSSFKNAIFKIFGKNNENIPNFAKI